MKKRYVKIAMAFAAVMLSWTAASAQTQGDIVDQADGYVWLDKLHQWQDLKFGVLLHWGIYSVPGIVESWSICDENWIKRDTTMTYQQYTDWYYGFADQFCPRQFDASQWARACRDAGMRYMVFTTKHHDGFCMWDSQETDFSIARHAFRDDSRRDVLRFVVEFIVVFAGVLVFLFGVELAARHLPGEREFVEIYHLDRVILHQSSGVLTHRPCT